MEDILHGCIWVAQNLQKHPPKKELVFYKLSYKIHEIDT